MGTSGNLFNVSAEAPYSYLIALLSKIIPENPYTYLAAIVPGFFFEVSIFLGNSALISQLAAEPVRMFAIGRSTGVAIALILTFIIGYSFILIPVLVQYCFRRLYWLWWFLWKRFCKWALMPFLRWLLSPAAAKPGVAVKASFWSRLATLQRFYTYAVDIGFSDVPDSAQRAWQCWVILARRLLSVRYGIKPEDVTGDNLGILYWVLGSPAPEDARGYLVLIALEATGWAGLAATRIAPALKTKYYFYFCAFLILNGLFHDFYTIRFNTDVRAIPYLRIRAILRELRQLPRDAHEHAKP
jgi:hypothetical protein